MNIDLHDPQRFDLIVKQGSDAEVGFKVCCLPDPAAEDQTPEPLNLAGCSARMHVRTDFASADAVDELSTDNGRIFFDDDPSTGVVWMSFTAAATAAYPPRQLVYDLEITGSGGEVVPVLEGFIFVAPEVTHD
ncbi:hypothetical protein [Sutterella sp.]|uniref:hypothetical protein n=1 Tax=Sutterella sp. TaxID=1981025 RepID=UPI0026E10F58|nr:hypothetical protein [Sutterella sp.]MDO5531436.1 hypothetical protein [Sutterella sp.]